MRFDQVRPLRTMTAVENALSTSFWAVPDFSRVEPAIASGPVSRHSVVSTRGVSGAAGFEVISVVWARAERACSSAPPT